MQIYPHYVKPIIWIAFFSDQVLWNKSSLQNQLVLCGSAIDMFAILVRVIAMELIAPIHHNVGDI